MHFNFFEKNKYLICIAPKTPVQSPGLCKAHFENCYSIPLSSKPYEEHTFYKVYLVLFIHTNITMCMYMNTYIHLCIGI